MKILWGLFVREVSFKYVSNLFYNSEKKWMPNTDLYSIDLLPGMVDYAPFNRLNMFAEDY